MDQMNEQQRSKFVNREYPLSLVQKTMEGLRDDPALAHGELIQFWGMGGKGKTYLKEHIKKNYDPQPDTVVIDWNCDAYLNNTYSIPEVLIHFRNAFVRNGFQMEQFTKYITFYRKCMTSSLPDLIDENEESVTKSLLKGIFDVISQATVFGTAIEGIINLTQTSSRKNKSRQLKKEFEEFSQYDAGEMLAVLLQALIEDVNHELGERKLLFIIDTFEDFRSFNMDWIFSKRTEFRHVQGLFYALLPSLWIVLGRDQGHFHEKQMSIALDNFNFEETVNYLDKNFDQLPQQYIEPIWSISKGYPLLLSELHYDLVVQKESLSTQYFERFKIEGAVEHILKHRYKKYFSESYIEPSRIQIIKILFGFKRWTLPKDDLYHSHVYRFIEQFYPELIATLDVVHVLEEQMRLSFIHKVAETKTSLTYEIDKSIYAALYDQKINQIPVLSSHLRQQLLAFFIDQLPKVHAGEQDAIDIQDADVQVALHRLIELYVDLYKGQDERTLCQTLMQRLEHQSIAPNTLLFVHLHLLEQFPKETLESGRGQQLILSFLSYMKKIKDSDYVDRFVYLLDGINSSQSLNEQIGHYFFDLGRYQYAQLFLRQATPSFDAFQDAMQISSFQEDNAYRNPGYMTITIEPEKLIQGIDIPDEYQFAVQEERDLYAFRKFLLNMRLYIRAQMKLEDNRALLPLLRKWETILYFDEDQEDTNVMHAIWLFMDIILLQQSAWYPNIRRDLEEAFFKELKDHPTFALQHPTFLLTLFRLSNMYLQYGYESLSLALYETIGKSNELAMRLISENRFEATAYYEVANNEEFSHCIIERFLLLHPKRQEESNPTIEYSENEIAHYIDRRNNEGWALPAAPEQLSQVGFLDLKVIKYVQFEEYTLQHLNRIIDTLQSVNENSLQLASFYFEKGFYLLKGEVLEESAASFQTARRIVSEQFGSFVETAKVYISYETYDLLTTSRLLQAGKKTIDQEMLEKLEERAKLNLKMIMNSYEDGLPQVMNLYLHAVEVNTTIESLAAEASYKRMLEQIFTLLPKASETQLHRAVVKLARQLFLQTMEMYNHESLFYFEKLNQNPLHAKLYGLMQTEKDSWDRDQLPVAFKEDYYDRVIIAIKSLFPKHQNMEHFFTLYYDKIFQTIKLFHEHHGDLDSPFSLITSRMIEVQFNNRKKRIEILRSLLDALSSK